MDFKAPRGTFDILPDQAQKRAFIEATACKAFEAFGYRRIITPTFERTELFARGIGEATEIVQKEMYTFTDRAGRSLTLRPEGTAPVVRAFIEHNMFGAFKPVKLYYIGQMFRYERPQAGRYREFWQLGIEALGSRDPALDAEVIILLMHFLQELGLRDLDLLVNSMGCKSCRPGYVEQLRTWLAQNDTGICEDCLMRARTNPLRVFDCKRTQCASILEEAPHIHDYWCSDCSVYHGEVLRFLDAVGVNHQQSPGLVRGFDYYTGTTFEIQARGLGAQNAIAGGGRYDDLVKEYGGPDMPGIGFAIGTDRMLLALEAQGIDLVTSVPVQVYLVTMDTEARSRSFQLLFDLRIQGIAAEMDYNQRSFKAQLRQADSLGAAFAVIIGPDELAQNSAQIKDMTGGAQETVKLARAVEYLNSRLVNR